MASPPTILVATDFSASSQHALDYAAKQAKMTGAKLLIVHVFAIPSIEDGEGQLHHGHGDDSDTAERRLRALIPGETGVDFEHRMIRGEPAAQLLRLANDEDVDSIVMGTHGRSGLMRVLLGSVAERVLRGASCPVVTVRVPKALS